MQRRAIETIVANKVTNSRMPHDNDASTPAGPLDLRRGEEDRCLIPRSNAFRPVTAPHLITAFPVKLT